MGSVVDNLTREDVIRLLIERRRMETLGEIVGFCIFVLMLLNLAYSFVNCF